MREVKDSFDEKCPSFVKINVDSRFVRRSHGAFAWQLKALLLIPQF